MKRFTVAAIVLASSIISAAAQISPNGSQGSVNPGARARPAQGHQARNPVATQPSNNPFQNPIGQGVPPAVSANPNNNSNRTLR